MKQLTPEIVELLNKKSTIVFLNAARQFVTLIENSNLYQNSFYEDSHKALSELYMSGLELETIDLLHSEAENKLDEVTNDELRKINSNLISILGKDCFYWDILAPTNTEQSEKPVQSWLVDDFANMYVTLNEEITKIDQIGTNEAIEDALWKLKFGFHHHWGNHCINAMRALHYLWYDGKTSM